MESMHDKYHKVNNIETVYKNRINNELVTKINLVIKPISKNVEYQLYYLPEENHSELIATIYKNDKKLNQRYIGLPKIARDRFIKDILIDELKETNEIEGVKSTKKELYQSMDIKFKKKTVRFKSLIKSYSKLLSGDFKLPNNAKDIRNIYNLLVKEEILETQKIDGELFRKDEVEVLKQSGSGEVVHKGVSGESNITKAIQELLSFINKDQKNLVIKLAIFHYYFCYIHPFYDGNGRTARFITSLYLKKELSKLTAISLSSGILINKNNYFKLFEKTNSFKNYGELNGFITMFLNALISGQEKALNKLNEKTILLKIVNKKIQKSYTKRIQQDILYIFAQQRLFSYEHDVMVSELFNFLKQHIKISMNSLKNELAILETEKIIQKTSKKPIKYKIELDFFLSNDI